MVEISLFLYFGSNNNSVSSLFVYYCAPIYAGDDLFAFTTKNELCLINMRKKIHAAATTPPLCSSMMSLIQTPL